MQKRKKKKRRRKKDREKRRGTEQDSNPAPSAPRDFTLPLPISSTKDEKEYS